MISKGKIDLQNLKKLRENKGYLQTKLEHLVGVSGASIQAYEQGVRIPSLPVTYRLSEVLGCSIDYLVGKSNEINNYYQLSQSDKDEVVKLINDLYNKSK